MSRRHPNRPSLPVAVAAVALSLLMAAYALAACSPTDRFVAGEPLDAAALESIRESLIGDETTAPPTEPAELITTAAPLPGGTVYWMKSGQVYHNDPNCPYLRDAITIKHGTKRDAALAGKDRLCAACRDRETEPA